MKTETPTLASRWEEYRQLHPAVRIRDAAKALETTEAQLLATRCGSRVTRMEGDWTTFIRELPKLGRVMCLTRNEAAVHERYGEFEHIDFFHGMGQVVGPDIDLRLFMNHWQHGFAVREETKNGERLSFQFFDASGDAVHKVFLQPESNAAIFGLLAHRFLSPNQSTDQEVLPPPQREEPVPDSEIDIEGFRQAWLTLKDTHGFFPLLKKFHVAREQALRLAPEGHATRIPLESTRKMLEAASEKAMPVMVFIGSRGCIQIHTGPVKNIKMFATDWLNVLDDDFNMHLYQPLVKSAWIVRKPTTDGIVTSLELYDADGENIALFFGKRKPGQGEDPRWRGLTADLEAGE